MNHKNAQNAMTSHVMQGNARRMQEKAQIRVHGSNIKQKPKTEANPRIKNGKCHTK